MESFGLFDLLKSLFLFKEISSAPTKEKNISSPADEKPTQEILPTQTEDKKLENTPQNACLAFINRHDELSRRRKQK